MFMSIQDSVSAMLCDMKRIMTIFNRNKKRNTKPYVIWIYGPHGSGKTPLAYKLTNNDKGNNVYEKEYCKLWDGYKQQRYCIIDDFHKYQIDFNYLIKLLDKYPVKVEVSKGFKQFNSSNIIITCVYHPSVLYKSLSKESINRLLVRLDRLILCRGYGQSIEIESIL
ncbi:CNPV200 Rep-like protein [Canarypox virus]|uniref:CNPV200 Rep-like protein n=1 Tax=Canarypox virus TaxID=44088 RepID=Q6VZE7_CNPV|nr:CNPV200 Rep-like protein [Canarypox virus]AAR83546.1 CNPV200 Rep-like protein [Canarypox virus]AWD84676.1 Rep-like protein [Canarypox virus]